MQRLFLILILFVFFTISGGMGCSPSQSSLSGTIMLNGQPLNEGSIQLIPESGNTIYSPTGATIRNGQYKIPADPGISEGTYTVRISSPKAKEGTTFSINDPKSLPRRVQMIEQIPPEWNHESKNTIQIKKGTNKQNFSITTK
jgi:hypothetical protein